MRCKNTTPWSDKVVWSKEGPVPSDRVPLISVVH